MNSNALIIICIISLSFLSEPTVSRDGFKFSMMFYFQWYFDTFFMSTAHSYRILPLEAQMQYWSRSS